MSLQVGEHLSFCRGGILSEKIRQVLDNRASHGFWRHVVRTLHYELLEFDSLCVFVVLTQPAGHSQVTLVKPPLYTDL